jgi:23S rRNA (cytosine1962-C5)-methyltransferase
MGEESIPTPDPCPPIPTLRLKSGKDRPVRFGHPWVFSGAIRDLSLDVAPGTIVRLHGAEGDFLGIGYVNPRCSIAVRMLTVSDEAIDASFIDRRLESAIRLREEQVASDTNVYRVVNGEGDRLPGFLVDRFDDVLILQCLTAGAERLKGFLVESLASRLHPRAIAERSGGSVRQTERLHPQSAVLFGELPDEVSVRENGLQMFVPTSGGQKTGHFCDQRPNRSRLRELARGRRVLDCFTYSGGFAVHAGAGGAARVVAVDSSAPALALARRCWSENGLDLAGIETIRSDVHTYLRETQEVFDLLVLDPPALVKQRKDVTKGARAYKDLHLWAFRRAGPGTSILTFTCSQHIDAELFRKIVLGAAVDARREIQLVDHLGPGPDHPISLGHPEGEYLHGLLLRVL